MSVSEDVSCEATEELKGAEGKDDVSGVSVCSICGRIVDKVYQNNVCKPCLLQEFRGYIRVIDDFQASVS